MALADTGGTRGKLLVVEGPEGAGKTTVVRRIGQELERAGRQHREFREPGGTILGEKIREILLGNPSDKISASAEAALFMASRAELVEKEIKPELFRGTLVTLDRFFLSTYAYQIYGRCLDADEVIKANALATERLVPDLTVLLMLPAEVGMRRADKRSTRDRMESAGDAFHRRVQDAFGEFAKQKWQRSHPECGPIVGVEGTGTEDEVWSRVFAVLAERLPDTFSLAARHER